MDLSYLLDSTAMLFVAFAIAALGILWLYVTLGEKQEQPNLSVLYEPVPVTSKAATGKKTNKGKAKKQVSIYTSACVNQSKVQSLFVSFCYGKPPQTNPQCYKLPRETIGF